MSNFKIGFDIDGCLLDFGNTFIEHARNNGITLKVDKVWNFFEQDIKAYDLFKNLSSDFWLNLPREKKSLDLTIKPTAYISHRSCPEQVTKESLMNAGFSDAPVFHVKYTEDKVKIAKQLNIDLYVDDRASTVAYFLENGINALVLDQIWNSDYNLPRVKKLKELNNIKCQKDYDNLNKTISLSNGIAKSISGGL